MSFDFKLDPFENFLGLYKAAQVKGVPDANAMALATVNKENQPLFSAISNREDLNKIPLGQVKYWHDTPILKANHLNVVETPTYLGTFKMLRSKRFQYFRTFPSQNYRDEKTRSPISWI